MLHRVNRDRCGQGAKLYGDNKDSSVTRKQVMGRELVKCTLDVVSVPVVRWCEGGTIKGGNFVCNIEHHERFLVVDVLWQKDRLPAVFCT